MMAGRRLGANTGSSALAAQTGPFIKKRSFDRSGAPPSVYGSISNPAPHDAEMYKWRHLVESFSKNIKYFKWIALNTCKADTSFAAMITLDATVIRTR
jgi:hypothetical protein